MRALSTVPPQRSALSAPIEVPEDILERVRALCLALPEVTVRVDYSRIRTRSTAYSFDSIGHPFFAPRGARDRIGVVLTDDIDWDEVGDLVIESYRILAPKKLTALLDHAR